MLSLSVGGGCFFVLGQCSVNNMLVISILRVLVWNTTEPLGVQSDLLSDSIVWVYVRSLMFCRNVMT